MPKHHHANTKAKRRYLVWRADAKGCSEATIAKEAASISIYEAFLDGKDFRAFHSEVARAFKRHLDARRNKETGSLLSQTTKAAILRDVRAFFRWLADQPGYKSKINRTDVEFLSVPRKVEMAGRGGLWKPHPSPEQVCTVLRNMPEETVLQRRDRAAVAFLFLTGSREGAAISLRLGQIDLENRCVNFDGRLADTKFGKSFTTAFFPFDDLLERLVREWVIELRQVHGFSSGDTLLPKTKIDLGKDRRFSASGIDRRPWASASSLAKIFKAAFRKAGLPPHPPHRVRDTVVELGERCCKTPEEFKAWSQNMGHDNVLTTFTSYGNVAPGRQIELMARFRESEELIEDF